MKDGEEINQRTFMHNIVVPRKRTTIRRFPRGGERVSLGKRGEREKSGNNCSILNNNINKQTNKQI